MDEQTSGQPPPSRRQPPPIPVNPPAGRTPPPLPMSIDISTGKTPRWVIVSIVLCVCFIFFAWFNRGSPMEKQLEPSFFAETIVLPPPAYMTLIGEGMSGSGFHFECDGEQYIACSIHQFDGEVPKVMGSLDIDGSIEIIQQVSRQDDVQVLTFASDQLRAIEPLKYDRGEIPAKKTTVYLYDFDDVYSGKIVGRNPATGKCVVKMDSPFPAAGNSGSPVVSALDGTVIGVVLEASDATEANVVVFEYLDFSPPE